jgi:short-subunit dehydrogenase
VRGELNAQGTLVVGVYPGPIDTDMATGFEMEKETPQHAAQEIFKGIESGAEEVYPDKVSKDFVVKHKADAKAVEKEWAHFLPQAVGR